MISKYNWQTEILVILPLLAKYTNIKNTWLKVRM